MKKRLTSLNLLEGNILKNLLLLSAPLMLTSFINMAYNMTDTAWLGRLGTDAVAATGAAHFFIWFSAALMNIARVGTSVYVAQEYGSKKVNRMNNSIKNGAILMALILGLYTCFVNVFAENFMNLYSLENHVKELSVIYLKIFSYGFIISGLNTLISNIYYALGNSVYPLFANVTGLVFNIVLDPIMIFGFGPIPALGAAGAAWASILSQFIVLLFFIFSIIRAKNEMYYAFIKGIASLSDMVKKFKKGLPAGLMSATHAAISLQLTRYMTTYGTGPVAAFTVGSMLESITWMTAEGFQGGITSFVGQNYGAKLYDRLKEIIRKSMAAILAIGAFGSLVLIIFRYPLFKVFIPDDPETLEYGAKYLYILGMSQLFSAIEIGAGGVFNGLGQTKIPAFISMIFNVLRIPMALALMPIFAYQGIWMAMTISSILKGLFSGIYLSKTYKEIRH